MSADLKAHSILRFFLLTLVLLFSSAAIAQESDSPVIADTASTAKYKLGAGDVIIITVHNHADLSGTFQLDGTGTVSMSLIGTVDAAGLTAPQLETRIVNLLKPDYLVNPRVTVRVQNYRPYYLMGEVNSTGAFPYVAGMSYLTAIAIAGGFSYRAKQDHVFVIRADDTSKQEIKLSIDEKVQPGDIIRVDERMF